MVIYFQKNLLSVVEKNYENFYGYFRKNETDVKKIYWVKNLFHINWIHVKS